MHLHVSKFTSDPGIRFFLNGGKGQINKSGGPEGNGGNGGDLYSTVDVGNYMVSVGGQSPSRKSDGQSGMFVLDSAYASWLHPNFLHLVVNYYKEGFYAGLTDPVVKNLRCYSDVIEQIFGQPTSEPPLFAEPPVHVYGGPMDTIEEKHVLEIAQISDEINRVFYNIRNNLDYYGNPPGWVPMLSFEVAKDAYTSEVDHALNVFFLDKLIQTAIKNLEDRQDAFSQLRDEAQVAVEGARSNFFYLADEKIPTIKNDIDRNLASLNRVQQELENLKQELESKAKDKYDERRTWKWVGVAGKVLEAIPSPYTKAAATALSVGVSFFASDNQKIGFQGGQGMGETIKQTLEPFISGKVIGQAKELGTNVYTGVGNIFQKLGNIGSIQDVVAIAQQSKKLYDNNKQLAQNVTQSVKGAVNLYNSVIRVDNDELGAIKGELLANEPRIGILAEEMQNLAAEQQKLGHELETATQEMQNSKNDVYIGLAAIGNFSFRAYDASAAYDHKLSVLSFDMKRKAFERLRKYYYYMLKAYEYRTIDTSLGALWGLNLNSVLAKIDQLITVDGKTRLTPADLPALRSLYLEPLHVIADKIYDYYQANQAGKNATSKLTLTENEIRDLNLGKPITINMVDKGLFPTSNHTDYREDIRIANIKVKKVVMESTK